MIATEKDLEMHTMTLDGEAVSFTEGETIYEVAQRLEGDIPTLCYDPRLEPYGSCRLCVVEVEGQRLPVASCTTKATPGMVVKTRTAGIEKHRKTLLEMVASENRELDVDPLRSYASQELTTLVDRYDARTARFQGARSGASRQDDDNPFILRDYDLCISCYRCVRVCAEQEGDHAISVRNRGFDTQITVEFDGLLKDSACTFCGQCVGEIEKTRTICPYCGVGCSVDMLTKGDQIVGIQPAMDGPANLGALCVKGQFAYDFVQHPDRLRMPLVRGDDGNLHETDWDTALDRTADGFRKVVDQYGRHSLYAVASGRAPHEAAYSVQKLMRAGWGINHIDNCSRA
jgi:predicted molibdopterin-dependent oxidoreductase YjgC